MLPEYLQVKASELPQDHSSIEPIQLVWDYATGVSSLDESQISLHFDDVVALGDYFVVDRVGLQPWDAHNDYNKMVFKNYCSRLLIRLIELQILVTSNDSSKKLSDMERRITVIMNQLTELSTNSLKKLDFNEGVSDLKESVMAAHHDTLSRIVDKMDPGLQQIGEVKSVLLEIQPLIEGVSASLDSAGGSGFSVKQNVQALRTKLNEVERKIDVLPSREFEEQQTSLMKNAFDEESNSVKSAYSELEENVKQCIVNTSEKFESILSAMRTSFSELTQNLVNLQSYVVSNYKSWVQIATDVSTTKHEFVEEIASFEINIDTMQRLIQESQKLLDGISNYEDNLSYLSARVDSILSKVPSLNRLDDLLKTKNKIEGGRLAVETARALVDIKDSIGADKQSVF